MSQRNLDAANAKPIKCAADLAPKKKRKRKSTKKKGA